MDIVAAIIVGAIAVQYPIRSIGRVIICYKDKQIELAKIRKEIENLKFNINIDGGINSASPMPPETKVQYTTK